MSILLTGGLGFIGSHIVVELVQNNYDVIVVDNLSNSNLSQLQNLEQLTNKKINFHNVNMLNSVALEQIFINNKINSVIHLAGFKAVGESVQKPLKYYSHNLQILFNLLDLMKKYDCKNLVFSSSATVYGKGGSTGLTEQSPTGIDLTNPYGKTKYFQEEILADLHKSDTTFNITMLRYFNPAGGHPSGIIGESPQGIPANLFPCIIRSIKEKQQLKIYGNTYDTHDGTCIRDFLHVVDLAKAHIAVLNCKGFNVYNVGTGKKTSVLDVITTFEKVNDIKLDYAMALPRDGDAACTFSDCSKINNELEWKAEKNIEDMCKDSYLFYLKNI
jgi:UDP-glucose 4-epimerase